MVNQASGSGAGVVPGIMGNRHPSITPYETFETADRPIALAVGNDKQFAALVYDSGSGDLHRPAFQVQPGPGGHREALCAILAEAFRTRGATTGMANSPRPVCQPGPINSLAEAFSYAEQLGLGPRPGTRYPPRRRSPIQDPLGDPRRQLSVAPPSLGGRDDDLHRPVTVADVMPENR